MINKIFFGIIVLIVLLIGIILFNNILNINYSPFSNNNTPIINFCSFYSEGPPNDEAANYSGCVPEILKRATGHFNKITFYTPKKLRELGYGKYLREYEDSPIIRHKTILKVGLSAFRPAMFLHELSQMNDGDILFHRDFDCKRNPVFANFDNIESVILKILKECQFDFFVPNHDLPGHIHTDTYKLKVLTKTNIIRELGEDHPFTYNFPMLHAYMFVIRKSKASIELLTEWQRAMENPEWMDGIQYGHVDPEFTWTTLDQSVLSVIIANWIRKGKYNIPKKYPFIAFRDKDHTKMIYFKDIYNYE
jgi:hypothetical protein